MIFLSPHAGLTVHISDPTYITDISSGFREQARPSLVADFLDPTCVASGVDAQGNAWNRVRGGSFDTDEAAARLGWSPEEKARTEAKLMSMARDPREPVTLWEQAPIKAPLTNYAKLSPARVLAIAAELEIVPEVLEYERSTENRPELVGMLEKKAAALAAEASVTESLTAA